jgi:hopanoid biosynthesis associated protein HpnK
MIRVIVNADDFGLSPGVNRGIVGAFRDGVLSSTTMMVNMPSFDDAVRLAKENPDLPVGVHLSLIWGGPIAPAEKVPTLVDSNGEFPANAKGLALRYVTGRLADAEVRTELQAQIKRFLDAGLAPTHVDTHKHIHCLPRVLDALIAVATEMGVSKIRLPIEAPIATTPQPKSSLSARAKVAILRALLRGARRKFAAAGITTTDHFAGLRDSEKLNTEALERILAGLQPGVTEIMCHPGESEERPSAYGGAWLNRQTELDALRDARVKERIAASNIQLISFRDI